MDSTILIYPSYLYVLRGIAESSLIVFFSSNWLLAYSLSQINLHCITIPNKWETNLKIVVKIPWKVNVFLFLSLIALGDRSSWTRA